MAKLTVKAVEAMKTPGLFNDGDGLYLNIHRATNDTLTRSWIFRFVSPTTHKTRDMGLGKAVTFGLKEARDRARSARQLVADGIDPVDARDARRAPAKTIPTFRAAALAYIKTHEVEWRGHDHVAEWTRTLNEASEIIGSVTVDAIDTAAVLKVLQPMYLVKAVTADRLRGRIENVLDAAKALGHRSGDNPAAKKNLKGLLPKQTKAVGHEAMDYRALPAFMAELRSRDGLVERCLEFTVLTAARRDEARLATWSEIDLEARMWTVPASRMKAGLAHRVALSGRAIEILTAIGPGAPDALIFGHVPINGCLHLLGRKMGRSETMHGFRATFSTWASEATNTSPAIVEMALAHGNPDKVAAAYQRSDLLDKRRALAETWSDYCHPDPGKIVELRRA